MRIIIAPDKFKGCMSAQAVAQAIADGLRQVDSGAELDLCPMADGGEGTVAALVAATGGRMMRRVVSGPLVGMKVEADFGLLGDGQTAVIEMAAASGLALLRPEQRNPLRTTTYGTGELIDHAVNAGARHIILGIGGSATVDGGLGCAQACGARITLTNGTEYGPGDRRLTGADVANVLRVARVGFDTGRREHATAQRGELPDMSLVRFTVACDVSNVLFGPNGAAPIFGPQKGATPQQVALLDGALEQLAVRTDRLDVAQTPGAGAAGGLGFGMMAFFDATLRSGIEIVAEAAHLRQRLAGADVCFTGEGCLDGQSAAGKTAVGVARICQSLNIPCIALAGAIGPGAEQALSQGLDAYFAVGDRPMSLDEAMAEAPRLLASTAANLMRLICATGGCGHQRGGRRADVGT